jgi:hypothetical protein
MGVVASGKQDEVAKTFDEESVLPQFAADTVEAFAIGVEAPYLFPLLDSFPEFGIGYQHDEGGDEEEGEVVLLVEIGEQESY